MRNFELDIFQVLQRRQRLFIKVELLSLVASVVFLGLTVLYRWPLFLAAIPIVLTGPFVMSVVTARCPHCQRPVHRRVHAIFRPLDRCSRCGFPR